MLKSISYVVKENITNLYRIFCIAKYELLADMRDSKVWSVLELCFSCDPGHYILACFRHRHAAQRVMTVSRIFRGSLSVLRHGGIFPRASPHGCSAIFSQRKTSSRR